MRFKYTLERYKGSYSRHTCPQCGAKGEFVRYVDSETGEPLADDVGRCNRESKCGYHQKPQDYFTVNGYLKKKSKIVKPNFAQRLASVVQKQSPKPFDCISPDVFLSTIGNYEQNAFVQWLLSEFEAENVKEVIERYFIGTASNGRSVFWQIDDKRRIRTGKIIAYDKSTGKRRKDTKPSFVHAELKHSKVLPENFELNQCLFGEHLLQLEPEKPVAIVEAEKTAIISSIFFPELVWLATGGKQQLTPDKLKSVIRHRIILFPDADAWECWAEKAQELQKAGLNVQVSDLIEESAKTDEKYEGLDIADYLLQAAKQEINVINNAIDNVLNNKDLFAEFVTIVEERYVIAAIDGNLSEEKAFEIATEPDYLRNLAVKISESCF
jgi:hypothetical protein